MQSDRIISPFAVGIFKPRIILPKSMDISDKPLLNYVLTHEYIHIKRYDALWKFILLIALCVHWFNPLVWLMLVLTSRDLELTCDEAVIHRFGVKTKKAYAYMLIGMAEQQGKFTPLYNNFAKNAINERINSIMKTKKVSIPAIIISIVFVAGILTVFVTAKEQTDNIIPNMDILMSSYDEDDNLIWCQALDESGNIVYLDYEPEYEKGDIKLTELGDDISLFSRTVSCENGVFGEHKVNNGEMAIYTNNGGTWSLQNGQTIDITLDVTHEDWWGVLIGYYKDGEYNLYGYDPDLNIDQRHIISGKKTLQITVPEAGDYSFFMINCSAGPMLVNSYTISK
jgi:hypothetical protein